LAFEIEGDPHVNASVTEVPVEGRAIVEFVQESAYLAQVRSKFVRCDRRVVPTFPFMRRARCCGGGPCAGFPYLPDCFRLSGRVEPRGRGMGQAFDVIREPLRRCIRRIRAVEPEFDKQETATVWKQLEVRCTLLPKSVHDRAFESLQADGLERENLRDMIGGGKRVAVAKRNESAMLRARNQLRLGFEHNRARPLGPDEGPGNMEASLRQELVEVVARDSPGNVRIALAYLRRISISNPA